MNIKYCLFIIHHNQSAYVKGRTVFYAIRTIDDVLEDTERYKIDGRMVATYFQEAFDSINRNSAFGFGTCHKILIVYVFESHLELGFFFRVSS